MIKTRSIFYILPPKLTSLDVAMWTLIDCVPNMEFENKLIMNSLLLITYYQKIEKSQWTYSISNNSSDKMVSMA